MIEKKSTISLKFQFHLFIIFVFISLGLLLYYSRPYDFSIVKKFQMAGKKRKRSSKSNKMYKLQVYKFQKLYATETDQGPSARSGHRIISLNSAFYSIGGYNPVTQVDPYRGIHTRVLFHELWRFDFITRSWKQLECEKLPTELASCAAVLSGNLLFLYGGTGFPFGDRINDTVYVCKLPNTNSKLIFEPITIENEERPIKQYGQSIAIDGKYLYTVGGTDGYQYTMDVHRLNMKTRIWDKLFEHNHLTESPAPRYRHEIIHYKNYLYVLGGGTSVTTFSLEKIPAFDLNTNKWVQMKTIGDSTLNPDSISYPQSRRCHGCVQDPFDKFIIFINGGYNERQEFNDTWRLDLNTLEWKCINSLKLPYGTYFHSTAATADGRMIVFGGITTSANPHPRTADVYSAWIRVPKLADACWEALSYYISNKIIKLPENLRTLELPEYYESRLRTSFNFS